MVAIITVRVLAILLQGPWLPKETENQNPCVGSLSLTYYRPMITENLNLFTLNLSKPCISPQIPHSLQMQKWPLNAYQSSKVEQNGNRCKQPVWQMHNLTCSLVGYCRCHRPNGKTLLPQEVQMQHFRKINNQWRWCELSSQTGKMNIHNQGKAGKLTANKNCTA